MDLNFDFKFHRAAVVQRYLSESGKAPRVVVVTCGNSARKLRKVGLSVYEIGVQGPLVPTRWLTPEDIAQAFPNRFDATSGHLPLFLMLRVAAMLRAKHPEGIDIARTGGRIHVPSGSGESAVITALAFPGAQVVAVFNNSKPDTKYESGNVMYKMFPIMRIMVQMEGRNEQQ